MLVVMQTHATQDQVEAVIRQIESMGLVPHPMAGPTRTAIGITGNTAAIDPAQPRRLRRCAGNDARDQAL